MFLMTEQAIQRQKWSNWSGNVQATPKAIVYPASVEEVANIVLQCRREGRKLRVVGSGHSFTALVETDDLLMSLDRMQGLIEVDREARTATVWAGTKLYTLGELLFGEGLAQENLGDINRQSIAGAVSTGTHGTGRQFGSVATQIVGLTVVTGAGEVLDCTADSHPELFRALQVSLGALGIIVQVKLRLLPAYRLLHESRRSTVEECLSQLPKLADGHRHFEWFWFPYAEQCQLKFMNVTEEPVVEHKFKDYFNEVVMENAVFGLLSGMCRAMPRLSGTVSRISAASVPVARKVNWSHRLFATSRLVRFNEMEYNVPAEAMVPVIREMREAMNRQRFNVHFPVECRYAKGDDIWMSPAYGRDSAYIAVHMYKGMPYRDYFDAMEEIFLRYDGRPHWGKLHSLRASHLKERYPMMEPFLALRSELDPDGILLNPHLRQLFD